jgi:ethanolaminephosphotransferase
MVNSYYNVIVARHKAGKAIISPLFGLLPFGIHTAILVAWLHSSIRGGVELVHDARLLSFLLYWGMAAAYQVSQLILAHVTKSPFPYWNGMMVYSLFGAIDANAQWLFGRESLVQSSPTAANVFIVMSFVVALFNYIRFAREVIWQICDYTGIACFTVRKKDKTGHWVENEEELKKLK